jgi:hypothetical protein
VLWGDQNIEVFLLSTCSPVLINHPLSHHTHLPGLSKPLSSLHFYEINLFVFISTWEVSFCLSLNVLQFPPRCCKWQILLFYGCVLFHPERVPHFLYTFTHQSTPQMTHVPMKGAAPCTGCRCLFHMLISIPLDLYPLVGLLDHMEVLPVLWGTPVLFSIMAVLIYIPTNNAQGSFPPFLITGSVTGWGDTSLWLWWHFPYN